MSSSLRATDGVKKKSRARSKLDEMFITKDLLVLEQQLDRKYEKKIPYLSNAEAREWGSLLIGFDRSATTLRITKELRTEIFIRIAKKFTWYRISPLNFEDGLWETF